VRKITAVQQSVQEGVAGLRVLREADQVWVQRYRVHRFLVVWDGGNPRGALFGAVGLAMVRNLTKSRIAA